jgi:hypothetical protein
MDKDSKTLVLHWYGWHGRAIVYHYSLTTDLNARIFRLPSVVRLDGSSDADIMRSSRLLRFDDDPHQDRWERFMISMDDLAKIPKITSQYGDIITVVLDHRGSIRSDGNGYKLDPVDHDDDATADLVMGQDTGIVIVPRDSAYVLMRSILKQIDPSWETAYDAPSNDDPGSMKIWRDPSDPEEIIYGERPHTVSVDVRTMIDVDYDHVRDRLLEVLSDAIVPSGKEASNDSK